MAANQKIHSLKLPEFDSPPSMLIVAAPYYREIADQLIAGAEEAVSAVGGRSELVEVPGALEIPTAIGLASGAGQYDGFVALGCIIRGETTHYETVCNDSSRGLMLLGLDGVCVGNGILTVETIEQAQERARVDGFNKGGGAAEAALHLVALKRRFAKRPAVEQPPGDTFRVAGEAGPGDISR